jgi:hypothetical protein
MADKFFNEFPLVNTLSDNALFLIDQNNETRTVQLNTIKQYASNEIGSSEVIFGGFLQAGVDKTFTVPSGITKLKITACGSSGSGGTSSATSNILYPKGIMVNIDIFNTSLRIPYILPLREYISYKPTSNEKLYGITGSGRGEIALSKNLIFGAGGGAGGWCQKTLNVIPNQKFKYTCGTDISTISLDSWNMTANNGSDATNSSGGRPNGKGGKGGTISGTYDLGYVGENGNNAGYGGFVHPGTNGARVRDLNGNLSDTFLFSGYIYVQCSF